MSEQTDLVEIDAQWSYEQKWPIPWYAVSEAVKEQWRAISKARLENLSAAGFVRKSPDQTLPECYEGNRPRAKAFRDMKAENWAKVLPLTERSPQ